MLHATKPGKERDNHNLGQQEPIEASLPLGEWRAMGDVTVPGNATVKLGKVDGQLNMLARARAQAEGESPIEVYGEVICEGDAKFEGNLICSRLNVDHGRVEIWGALQSTGERDAEPGELGGE